MSAKSAGARGAEPETQQQPAIPRRHPARAEHRVGARGAARLEHDAAAWIKETGTKLKFEGIAQSSTRVSTLMRNISASQWLRNPELEVVETAKDSTGGSHFVLDATQVSVATDDDSSSSAPKRPVRTSSGSNK